MRLTTTRWGQIRDDAGYLCLAGDYRHHECEEQVADIVMFTELCTRHHGITFLRGSFSLLITGHLPTHAQYCANIDHDSHPSLNAPSVIIFSMGSKYLPSPV